MPDRIRPFFIQVCFAIECKLKMGATVSSEDTACACCMDPLAPAQPLVMSAVQDSLQVASTPLVLSGPVQRPLANNANQDWHGVAAAVAESGLNAVANIGIHLIDHHLSTHPELVTPTTDASAPPSDSGAPSNAPSVNTTQDMAFNIPESSHESSESPQNDATANNSEECNSDD